MTNIPTNVGVEILFKVGDRMDPVWKDACEKALGELAYRRLDEIRFEDLFERMESNALSLIEEIKEILDDESYSDEECFYKIDAIVMAFYRAGFSTIRHWEVD